MKRFLPEDRLVRSVWLSAAAAKENGYDFNAEERCKAMDDYGDNNPLALKAVTSHAGVCTSAA